MSIKCPFEVPQATNTVISPKCEKYMLLPRKIECKRESPSQSRLLESIAPFNAYAANLPQHRRDASQPRSNKG